MLLLGGVPPIVMSKDMVDTMPDEKVGIKWIKPLFNILLSTGSNNIHFILVQTTTEYQSWSQSCTGNTICMEKASFKNWIK